MTKKYRKAEPYSSKTTTEKKDTAIAVAIIGLIGTIIVGFMSFSPLVNWLNAKLTPSPTPSAVGTIPPPVLDTPTEIPTISTILNSTDTPITFTNTPATPTLESQNEFMTVLLTASANEGRAPLTVNFNARNSFITFSDHSTSTCINQNVCSFGWDVRLDGITITGMIQGEGVFSYRFEKRGDYLVVVNVCRGDTCNYSAASVKVK